MNSRTSQYPSSYRTLGSESQRGWVSSSLPELKPIKGSATLVQLDDDDED